MVTDELLPVSSAWRLFHPSAQLLSYRVFILSLHTCCPKKPCPLKQFTLTALGIVKRFSCENDLRVDVSSEDTR